MKTHLFLYFFFLIFLEACVCHERQALEDDGEIVKSVTTFSAPVSCVSYVRDQIYYIGLENGTIVRMNKEDDSQTVILAGKSRVYDIVAVGDTIFAGLRDEGCKMIVSGKVCQTYSIVIPGYHNGQPVTNYAPYDVEVYQGDLFVATSSGVYGKRKGDAPNTPLTLLLRPETHTELYWGVHNIRVHNDSLYCATNVGLLVLPVDGIFDETAKRQPVTKIGGKVFQLLPMDDVLYACTDSASYRSDVKTGRFTSAFKADNLFAYCSDSCRGAWALSSASLIYMKENKTLTYSLPFTLSRSYKNYWTVGRDFLLLACHKQLFSFSKHQNSRGASNHVIAAHTQNDLCYLITKDHRLYTLPVKSKDPAYIATIHRLDAGCEVRGLCASKQYLWMITNEKLYRIQKETGDAVIVDRSADYKSIYYAQDVQKLYIGMRNDLCCISHPDQDTLGEEDIESIRPSKVDNFYATSILEYKYKDTEKARLYCSTLNSGLYCIADSSKAILVEGSDSIGNINKLIELNTEDFLLHTSKGIYLYNANAGFRFKTDSRQMADVFRKEKGLFVIGYSGIGTYRSDMKADTPMAFYDLSFNKVAIAEGGKDKLILGTPSGLYIYSSQEGLSDIILEYPVGHTWFGAFYMSVALFVVLVLLVWRVWIWRKKLGKTSELPIKPTKPDEPPIEIEPDPEEVAQFDHDLEEIRTLLRKSEEVNKIKNPYNKEKQKETYHAEINALYDDFRDKYGYLYKELFPLSSDDKEKMHVVTLWFLENMGAKEICRHWFINGTIYNNVAVGKQKYAMINRLSKIPYYMKAQYPLLILIEKRLTQ